MKLFKVLALNTKPYARRAFLMRYTAFPNGYARKKNNKKKNLVLFITNYLTFIPAKPPCNVQGSPSFEGGGGDREGKKSTRGAFHGGGLEGGLLRHRKKAETRRK